MTNPSSQAATTIPADDLARSLTLVQSDSPNLPHIGLVGDTYTILLAGNDTAGRYCLIDMHIPPGGGPPPHRHDFEEMFSVLEGEIEATFRGKKPSFGLVKPSTFQRTHLTNSKTRAGDLRDCYACARRQARKSFSGKLAFPSQRGRHRHPLSTARPRQRSSRRSKPLLRNTEPSFHPLRWRPLSNDSWVRGLDCVDRQQQEALGGQARESLRTC